MSQTKPNECKHCDGTGLVPKNWTVKDSPMEECYSCRGSGFASRYTDDIVCPYCGHEESDPWEHAEGRHYSCGSCGKDSMLEIEMTIEYTTYQQDCLNDKSLHKWKKIFDQPNPSGSFYSRCIGCRETKSVMPSELYIEPEETP